MAAWGLVTLLRTGGMAERAKSSEGPAAPIAGIAQPPEGPVDLLSMGVDATITVVTNSIPDNPWPPAHPPTRKMLRDRGDAHTKAIVPHAGSANDAYPGRMSATMERPSKLGPETLTIA